MLVLWKRVTSLLFHGKPAVVRCSWCRRDYEAERRGKEKTLASQTELTTARPHGTAATAPARQVGPRGKRLLFIANLRILLICGVLVNHLGVTYGSIGAWEYHDPVTNLLTGTVLSILDGILMACGMGVFFLIAGYFTPCS